MLLSDKDTPLQLRKVLCKGFSTLSLLVMEAGLSPCSAGYGAQPLSSSGLGRKSAPSPEWPCAPGKPSWSTCPSLLLSVHSVLGEGCHSCCWVMGGRLWVHYEGLLQQLQSDAAAEIPSQPPIPTCSLLPQDHPWHSRMVALGHV